MLKYSKINYFQPVLGALGAAGKYFYGKAKKAEGKAEQKNEFLEAKNTQERETVKYKNQYLKIQVPKRRNYQETIEDADSTADERADATFELFDRRGKQ